MSHRHTHTPEQLDPLGDFIDQLVLLVEVFVEQQVQLVKRRSRDLPMVLLVQITQRDRIGEYLVEILHAFFTDVLSQRDGQLDQVPERLDLVRLLMRQRLGLVQNRVSVNQSLRHECSPLHRVWMPHRSRRIPHR